MELWRVHVTGGKPHWTGFQREAGRAAGGNPTIPIRLHLMDFMAYSRRTGNQLYLDLRIHYRAPEDRYWDMV